MHKSLLIRHLENSDIPVIVDAFLQSNWTEKPSHTFEQYLDEQTKQERHVWVAYINNQFAGYVTLKWVSNYQYFKKKNIPEIIDLNVLPNFRNSGIGSKLLHTCEEMVLTKTDTIGIGVGLYPDYGAAQKLYVKRGYIPDGMGVTYDYKPVVPGDKYPLDDDLVLWFTKKLTTPPRR